MTAEEIAVFLRLVSPKRGVLRARRQNDCGAYDGETFDVTDEHLRAHFEGSITLGFVCAENGRSRFLAIDVDERFGQKLPYIARSLERRCFDAATIVTSGSDAGRGKVIVFLARSYAVTTLQQLARDTYADARQVGGWSMIEAASAVDYRPARGEGGLLRIGSRNRKPSRNARTCDVFMSLDGEPRSFADVIPISRVRTLCEVRHVEPHLTRWARGVVEKGIDKHPGSGVLYRRTLPRLGREYVHVFGAAGEEQFIAATEQLWDRSPALHQPSPKNRDPRARKNFERGRAHAWKTALELRKEALHHPAPVGCNASLRPSAGSKALYCFLASWVEQHQLHSDAFAISSRVVADHLGLTAAAGWKRIARGERQGVVVVHDRGTCGPHGFPMVLGLVGENHTRESVLERGRTRPVVLERAAARKRHEAL